MTGRRPDRQDLDVTSGTSNLMTLQSLATSAPVAEAIDAIVGQLREAQASITAPGPDGLRVRPPAAELAEPYERYLARQEAVKGRPPLYPYVGSGLGAGALVQLADGSVKWDLINGIGVHMFGHGDPDLVATALRAALGDVVMQGNLQFNAEAIELAELLVAEAGRASRIEHCFLINSGALANESALKLCYHRNAPASRVLAFARNFAGRTTTMVQIGDTPAGRVGLPLNVLVDYVPFYDAERPEASTEEAVRCLEGHIERYPGGHAAFVLELVQGEGGFNPAPREFFVALMERCRDHGIAVWLDEIQTFGRTGEMFCFSHLGLGEYVDLVTIGKLSQVCACLYTADYNPKAGLLSATFVGSTVALQVGRRMLERLRDEGYYGPGGRIERLQQAFRRHMEELVKGHREWFEPIPRPGGGTSGRFYDGVGGMMRFTPFAGRRAAIMKALRAMFDEGVIAFYCGHDPYHIRFLPPVGAMELDDFQEVFAIVASALARAVEEPDP